MSVRFIIGRAGTGKTYHCLKTLRTHLRQDPVDGPRLIFLVPEQAGLQMEQAILDDKDVPVAHRANVFSFQRLAFKVMQDVGESSQQAISDTARVMVVTHLFRTLSSQLRYYQKVDRLSGFCSDVALIIKELVQDGVTPEQLDSASIVHENDASQQATKIHDLQLIYKAYLDYLGEGLVDPSQYLEIARRHFSTCDWLCGAHVWVDGFASLSGQETTTLVELAKWASHLDITLLADAQDFITSQRNTQPKVVSELFRRMHATYSDMERAFVSAGIELQPALLLRPKIPPRYSGHPTIAQIEQNLFTSQAAIASTPAGSTPDVELVELPSRRLEAYYAASRICDWVQRKQNPLRYRDIAIIVRNLDHYHHLIAAALASNNIPYFIDHRRSLAHHPLIMLLGTSVQLADDGFSMDTVRALLKTGLLPICHEEADELENHLLAHGIEGRAHWMDAHWPSLSSNAPSTNRSSRNKPNPHERASLDRIDRSRQAFVSALAPWFELDAATHTKTGSEWATWLRDWLDTLNIETQLLQWSEEAQDNGDVDQAAEHRQVWRDVQTFFDELALAFEHETLTITDLASTLEQGLGALTLGIAPPMIDQVLVGAIERSRHPEVKAVLLLGFNDGVFPQPATENAILNDDDRAMLEQAGVPTRSSARDRTLDESMLAYVALTRASESLVVTYATSDENSKSLRPSPYVNALLRAQPGLVSHHIHDPIQHRQSWDIGTSSDLAGRLAMEFRMRPAIEDDQTQSRIFWNELYESLRSELRNDPGCQLAFQAIDAPRTTSINQQAAAKLRDKTLHTSVSRLETHATCPFKYFANYDLDLRERPQAALKATDIGTIYHAVLEDFFGCLVTKQQRLSDFSEAQVSDQLQQSWERVSVQFNTHGATARTKDAFTMDRTPAALMRVLLTQRQLAMAGAYKTIACELAFGFNPEDSLPALELTTPKGRSVALKGYIDRVDIATSGDELYGIVVDYKRTRNKKLDLSSVYHGLSLQLMSYLLVLEAHGRQLAGKPIKPLAGLYISLLTNYEKLDHPADHETITDRIAKASKPRGLLQVDQYDLLDNNKRIGWSDLYSVFLKKDGSLGHVDQGDAVDEIGLNAILRHTKDTLGALADNIYDGLVAVKPYRLGTSSPCTWCSFGSVCRFELGLCEARFLDRMKRSDVLSRITNLPC